MQQCLEVVQCSVGHAKNEATLSIKGLETPALLKLTLHSWHKSFFHSLQKASLTREFSVKCSENSLCCKPINSCREGWETQQPLEIYSPSARLNLVSSGQDYIEKILCTTFFCVQATALHTVAKSINCIFEKKIKKIKLILKSTLNDSFKSTLILMQIKILTRKWIL